MDATTKNVRQRKVTTQQENDLVQYIIGPQSENFLLLEMIQKFVRGMAHVEDSRLGLRTSSSDTAMCFRTDGPTYLPTYHLHATATIRARFAPKSV